MTLERSVGIKVSVYHLQTWSMYRARVSVWHIGVSFRVTPQWSSHHSDQGIYRCVTEKVASPLSVYSSVYFFSNDTPLRTSNTSDRKQSLSSVLLLWCGLWPSMTHDLIQSSFHKIRSKCDCRVCGSVSGRKWVTARVTETALTRWLQSETASSYVVHPVDHIHNGSQIGVRERSCPPFLVLLSAWWGHMGRDRKVNNKHRDLQPAAIMWPVCENSTPCSETHSTYTRLYCRVLIIGSTICDF